MGGSIVKGIYGWQLVDNNEKVVVKHFSGSILTEDMMKYIQPPLKRNPDRFIIHVETNDLRSNQDPETIARNILKVAYKTDTNKKFISSINHRHDNLNSKGRQVKIIP